MQNFVSYNSFAILLLTLAKSCTRENYNGTEEDYEDFGEESWEGEEEAGHRQPSFPAFCTRLHQTLRGFGGQMFCKLNWSSPKARPQLLAFFSALLRTGLPQCSGSEIFYYGS